MKRAYPAMLSTLTLLAASASAASAQPAGVSMCAGCHQLDASTPKKMGPSLVGVAGRHAGTAAGYAFSPAMKDSGIVWDKTSLAAFVADPRGTVPGNRMPYSGQKDPAKASAIADYILSLK